MESKISKKMELNAIIKTGIMGKITLNPQVTVNTAETSPNSPNLSGIGTGVFKKED